jgi:thiol-disulfide isomerase/thioredoxin
MQWSKDDIWFHLWKQEKVATLKEDFGSESLESDDGMELDDGDKLQWVNIPYKSLSLRSDLRGRLIVLDFFTTCCINCIHSLVELQDVKESIRVLEPAKHDAYVSWIGVHSPKFDYEREVQVVKQFCDKYGTYLTGNVLRRRATEI